ncbi:universal stress protein [Streptomyces sp. Go40/10]|uniref:universal stress protein n=1 Tax=Streptomyces sp. Go40/10 TaxID=2825844 RepID=UPI001E53CC4A|nr:universal stress protein [Streptomyces sp. Go40/10]UFR00271.1 universal stress protein [Streptomyces sp. Go40/10]
MQPVVTVGLDGSPESLAAARWAADEAETRGLPLRLLHAWPTLAPEPARLPGEAEQNRAARRLLAAAEAELRAAHPDLSVVGSLVADDAEHALLEAAAESEVTVIGSRGLEPAESYFLGDVGLPVVARARRPVVLVRAGTTEQEAPTAPAGRVVVALKLHGSSDDLLDFAFRVAAARSAPLLAVHGHGAPPHARPPQEADHGTDEHRTRDPRDRLDDALAPWRAKYPQADVAGSVRSDAPERAVVQAGEGAVLLVVGRRRHRAGPAPRLGPVAQAALHHGRCPVAVVPHD